MAHFVTLDLAQNTNATKQSLKKLHLPIDTRYFGQEFKEKLLETLTSSPVFASDKVTKQPHDIALDDLLDGLLIKSENWQALNLLLEKYKQKVKCIYIDPPFNSKATEILYRNFYKHSSWLSLMENRISKSKQLLEDKGVFVCAIDENEQERLGLLLNNVFPGNEKTCVSIVHNPRGIQGENFSYCHEFAYFVYPGDSGKYIGGKQREEPEVRTLRDSGTESLRANAKNCFYPFIVKDGKIIDIGKVITDDNFHPKSSNVIRKDGSIEIWPKDSKGIERKWRYARNSVEKILDKLEVKYSGDKLNIFYIKEIGAYRTVWEDAKYDASEYGTKLLQSMFSKDVIKKASYPKSLYNVKDCLHAITQNPSESVILDFFAGSGTTAHAIMELNKEDGGKRKYILGEMADYFDTVMIPRLKKVCYSFDWKDGKPQDTDGISQFFKYQILEQYDDTLDNIELSPNETAQSLFKDDYLLKYYLDYETRGNPSLLNIEMLKNPFAYKLRVNLEEVGEPHEMVVDIPETFNYLLGLKVKRIKARTLKCHPELVSGSKGMLKQVQHDKHYKRKYLFVLGEKEGKDIAIVWREYEDKPTLSGDEGWSEDDFKKDKEFIIKELAPWTPHIVYVNGQSVLTPKLGDHIVEIRYIEPEFKRLMEG